MALLFCCFARAHPPRILAHLSLSHVDALAGRRETAPPLFQFIPRPKLLTIHPLTHGTPCVMLQKPLQSTSLLVCKANQYATRNTTINVCRGHGRRTHDYLS